MSQDKAAQKTKPPPPTRPSYEFGGPFGAAGVSFGLPILLYLFNYACNDVSGCPAPSFLSPTTLDLHQLKREVGWPANGVVGLFSLEVTAWTLAYYLFNAVLYRVLPATEAEGSLLRSGRKLTYRMNSFNTILVTLTMCAAATVKQGANFPVWTFMTDNYVQLLTANILISYALATFVYLRSFQIKHGSPTADPCREFAEGGITGNMMYDWFIGRELNPRVKLPLLGEIDIKEFMELRPGMLGWILFNCAFIAKQYRTYGFVTDSIVFIAVVQAFYVLDGVFMEPAILTTMDITTDGFGCMLAFGDLVWVPFFYSMQTRYLSVYPVSLGPYWLTGVLLLLLTGFSIFRLANSQKNTFRTDPEDPKVAHLTYLSTSTGSRLITSGWWGVARHINYFGDWLQSWPYSLPTGMAGYLIQTAGSEPHAAAFQMLDGREVIQGAARGWGMVFTYFYVVYFAVLLIHRDGRDDEKCHRKYGADWEKYKKIVRWKIVPYVY